MVGYGYKPRATKANAAGEGYGTHADDDIVINDGIDDGTNGVFNKHMSMMMAMIPLILVIGVNALLTYVVFPAMDFSGLQADFPNLAIAGALGLWSIIISLMIACLVLIVMRLGDWNNLQGSINKGTYDAMLPVFNVGSEVGYGAVIATLAGFVMIRDNILNLSPNNPLISEAVAMTTLAGITGSSSGGLSIALKTLGEDYYQMALNAGIDPELMHRVAVMAAGGLDTLPHSGAVITVFAICGLTHKESYVNLAMVTMAIPIVATVVVMILGTMFGSF